MQSKSDKSTMYGWQSHQLRVAWLVLAHSYITLTHFHHIPWTSERKGDCLQSMHDFIESMESPWEVSTQNKQNEELQKNGSGDGSFSVYLLKVNTTWLHYTVCPIDNLLFLFISNLHQIGHFCVYQIKLNGLEKYFELKIFLCPGGRIMF